MVNDISFQTRTFVDFDRAVLRDRTGNAALPDGREYSRGLAYRRGKIHSSLISSEVPNAYIRFIRLTNMTITAAPYREIMHYHSLNVDTFSRW